MNIFKARADLLDSLNINLIFISEVIDLIKRSSLEYIDELLLIRVCNRTIEMSLKRLSIRDSMILSKRDMRNIFYVLKTNNCCESTKELYLLDVLDKYLCENDNYNKQIKLI